jgi:hypothetical protein
MPPHQRTSIVLITSDDPPTVYLVFLVSLALMDAAGAAASPPPVASLSMSTSSTSHDYQSLRSLENMWSEQAGARGRGLKDLPIIPGAVAKGRWRSPVAGWPKRWILTGLAS